MTNRTTTKPESMDYMFESFLKRLRAMENQPARLHWSYSERAWRLEVVDQVLDICDRGIWDGEELHDLLPASKDVFILICRVKLGLREFSGRLSARTIARELRLALRTVQLSFAQLERHELILVERFKNDVVDVRIHEKIFSGRWYMERMRMLSTSYQQADFLRH